VEAALREQAGVREAVVVVREEADGERRLVGYVVEAGEGEGSGARRLELSELRAGMEMRLPEYMRPQAVVILEDWPLTPNGKLDRKALPAPDFKDDRPERIYVAPRSEMEKMVAEIWTELLGIQAIGVEDNFFNIGGHSLLATQVVSRLRQRLAVEIPLLTLFESPTIAALASAIEGSQKLQTQTETPAITPRKREVPDVNKLLARLEELSASEARQLLDEMRNAKHVDNQ
jgi:acyl carrier protein